MKIKNIWLCLLIVFVGMSLTAAESGSDSIPTTREMNLLCWQEFKELVPARFDTVLLPVGSLEPHGVIPSGTDNLAPEAMARDIAVRVKALIAPTLNYGITPAMKAFPGAVSISKNAYAPFIADILKCLVDNKFKNIIILNGHGGNTSILQEVVNRVSNTLYVRILVVNWWSVVDSITKEVFGENGGHAGNNETAYVQAVVPAHIHPERYNRNMASVNPPAGAYYAVPVTSSIGLYEKGQGYPTFDKAQADAYFRKVNDRIAALIEDVIRKWELAGIYQ